MSRRYYLPSHHDRVHYSGHYHSAPPRELPHNSLFSVLTQLRTGHIGLNRYLYRFHLAPSPACALCNVPGSVPHFLLICPSNHPHRQRLVRRLGTARLSVKLLLSAKRDTKPVLDFVRDTVRFPRYSV
ncbi:hypothetical protein B0H14DRAFT_3436155 [Mycena olivaceomarginata]|nr:hypothetical protein B0H14DRAFT_3436155 [Mycena olivaceomarginata]